MSASVFQAINFSLIRTTKHQHTRNLSFFFTTFMAPVLDEVFRLLQVSKHLYTHGIPEQLSRQWPGTGPDSSQHLKRLGYYTLVSFLFCFLSFRLDKLFVAIQLY